MLERYWLNKLKTLKEKRIDFFFIILSFKWQRKEGRKEGRKEVRDRQTARQTVVEKTRE